MRNVSGAEQKSKSGNFANAERRWREAKKNQKAKLSSIFPLLILIREKCERSGGGEKRKKTKRRNFHSIILSY